MTDDRVIQPLDESFDFLDTAAIVMQPDLVIAVDSAVVHLSAAFGRPTWLINQFDRDWRWFFDGRTSSPSCPVSHGVSDDASE